MGGLRRRRAEEAEEEAVGALSESSRFAGISIGEIKPQLAALDTSNKQRAQKLWLRTACVRRAT